MLFGEMHFIVNARKIRLFFIETFLLIFRFVLKKGSTFMILKL